MYQHQHHQHHHKQYQPNWSSTSSYQRHIMASESNSYLPAKTFNFRTSFNGGSGDGRHLQSQHTNKSMNSSNSPKISFEQQQQQQQQQQHRPRDYSSWSTKRNSKKSSANKSIDIPLKYRPHDANMANSNGSSGNSIAEEAKVDAITSDFSCFSVDSGYDGLSPNDDLAGHAVKSSASSSCEDDCDEVFKQANSPIPSPSGGGGDNSDSWTCTDDDLYWLNEQQMVPPSDKELPLSDIARHINYYLSDEYLQRDKYLLRQVRCKKDGFISLKLITSFKNVKRYTSDCNVVRCAIVRKSERLVVSGDGFRVRRRSVLPDSLKQPRLLKTVLVSGCGLHVAAVRCM